MTDQPQLHSLDELLVASAATPEFKEALLALTRGTHPERIEFNPGAPPTKVRRVLMKVLETWPELPIDRARIQAISGCSNFIGMVELQPGGRIVSFEWDCRWQARELGWVDHFGEADQIRAARELDYQCFKSFSLK